MRKINALLLTGLVLVFVSCQKEIDWGTGASAGSDGDLLIKTVQVTPSTNDTNILTLNWDANKRLIQYQSAGKVSSIPTNIVNQISRASDGKITRILSKSSITAGLLDSVVYIPHYNGSQMDYAIDTQYTLLGPIMDSLIFTYAGGKVTSKETYTDLFFGLQQSAKETYEYDANGNVTTVKSYSPDGAGGYDLTATSTYTFDSHRSMITLGEESFLVLGAVNVSPKNFTKQVTNDVASGTTYTTVFTNIQFNSFNRPKSGTLKTTPQPPGYDVKLTMYYQ